jgi:alpha-tubulin suppressor-like RCC1 family protein
MAFNVLGEPLGSKYLKDSDIFEDYIGNTLWNWGYNGYGQLGNNTITSRSSPVQTVAGGTNWKSISSCSFNTSGIKTDGTLWSWGYNGFGGLGDNTTTNKSSPVQTVAGGTNWKLVSSGIYHISAIKTDGTLWTCGYNNNGQLGDNTVGTGQHKSSPVQTVAGGTNWKQVSCGESGFVGAIKTDGTLWLWGYNSNEQLGDNTVASKSSPVQTVAGGTNWKQVSMGNYYSAAIKTDGTLWLWGSNQYGQLGDNSVTQRNSPVQTVASGTNWKQVSCGQTFTSVIKTDGTLWLWGSNQYGQLGNNNSSGSSISSPIQTVASGTNWKQVNCGYVHTTAIKTDGTLWTWGKNNLGQLGDNTTTNYSSPIQTVAGGTNWKSVSVGTYFTSAVTFTDYQ